MTTARTSTCLGIGYGRGAFFSHGRTHIELAAEHSRRLAGRGLVGVGTGQTTAPGERAI